jgi:hypothetical protein
MSHRVHLVRVIAIKGKAECTESLKNTINYPVTYIADIAVFVVSEISSLRGRCMPILAMS